MNTPSILRDIVLSKTSELLQQKSLVPLNELKKSIVAQQPPLNFMQALMGNTVSLIAEVKKASPSRGLLCPDFNPVFLASTYSDNGASAISVLTDPRFQGELDHIVQIKESGLVRTTPILRKDFIFDPYQVYEARANGADAILLIAAILSEKQMSDLKTLAESLGMNCLIEIHDKAELEFVLDVGVEIVGINNRDLRTFTTDLKVTEDLAPLIPDGKIIVSESGISNYSHIERISRLGVNAVLVGEALVTSADVSGAIKTLMGQDAPTVDP